MGHQLTSVQVVHSYRYRSSPLLQVRTALRLSKSPAQTKLDSSSTSTSTCYRFGSGGAADTCSFAHLVVSCVALMSGSSGCSPQAGSGVMIAAAAIDRYVWYGSGLSSEQRASERHSGRITRHGCPKGGAESRDEGSPGCSPGALLIPPNLYWHCARNAPSARASSNSPAPRI